MHVHIILEMGMIKNTVEFYVFLDNLSHYGIFDKNYQILGRKVGLKEYK